MEEKEIRNIIREALEQFLNERKRKRKKSNKKKADRCIKIAKRKYNRWPSAYASGAVVQCRAGNIWKDLKGESVEYFGNINEVYNDWSRAMYLKEDSMVSEALKYHLDNGISLSECVFRYGSEEYFNIVSEVKNLYENDVIDLNENDEFIISEHDDDFCVLGGEKIKLNFIFEEVEDEPLLEGEEAKKILSKEEFIDTLTKGGWIKYINNKTQQGRTIHNTAFRDNISLKGHFSYTENNREGKKIQRYEEKSSGYGMNVYDYSDFNKAYKTYIKIVSKENLNEAEYQGKKVQVGKPKRGGSKKFYVYVRNPKTGKIKKVSFGAKSGGGNLAVKLKDPKARKRFADRHNCEQKNDRTTPGYWSCRLPRYAKQLGLSGGGKWW